MKKLITIYLITAVAISVASAVPVTDDLWDFSRGAVVTASSAIEPRSSASNMFGTNYGSIDAYTTIFDDWIVYNSIPYPIGTEHWVQWQTEDVVSLGSFKLYAAHDSGTNARSFDHFTLLAKLSGESNYTEIYDTDIAVPYEFIDDENTFLVQHTFAAPIIAQEFKAEFRQHTDIPWASGPRICELDGFAAIPEPTTMVLLGLGALSLLRRKKR